MFHRWALRKSRFQFIKVMTTFGNKAPFCSRFIQNIDTHSESLEKSRFQRLFPRFADAHVSWFETWGHFRMRVIILGLSQLEDPDHHIVRVTVFPAAEAIRRIRLRWCGTAAVEGTVAQFARGAGQHNETLGFEQKILLVLSNFRHCTMEYKVLLQVAEFGNIVRFGFCDLSWIIFLGLCFKLRMIMIDWNLKCDYVWLRREGKLQQIFSSSLREKFSFKETF